MPANDATCFLITGSLTLKGTVVYLDEAGNWVEKLENAVVFASEAAGEDRLSKVKASEAVITEPYTFVAERVAGQLVPTSAREKLRAEGPSTRLRRPDGTGAL